MNHLVGENENVKKEEMEWLQQLIPVLKADSITMYNV